MTLSHHRSLIISGVLGAVLALGTLLFLGSGVSDDLWNYPLPTGVHVGVSALLVIDHVLSAFGFVGVAALAGLSAGARRALLTTAVALVVLALLEAASGCLAGQPNDGDAATAVGTAFGICSLAIAVSAMIGGWAVMRQRLLPGADASVLASGALLLFLVTPANVTGSQTFRAVALAAWSLSFVWAGWALGRARLVRVSTVSALSS